MVVGRLGGSGQEKGLTIVLAVGISMGALSRGIFYGILSQSLSIPLIAPYKLYFSNRLLGVQLRKC